MLEPSAVTAGFALSAGLIVAIGSQNAFVLRQGIRGEHVVPVVIFCALADFALMATGVAGVGAALGLVPALVTALSIGGAMFLAGYGLTALRRATRPERLVTREAGAPLTRRGALVRAAGFTLLNPHVYLDTVLLVGSVGAAQPAGAQMSFLAGAGLASASWFAALGFGARVVAPLFARPSAWRVLDLAVGVTMIVLAVGLLSHGLGKA
jgi:L-lysine exporter family protein LysE/ArgO